MSNFSFIAGNNIDKGELDSVRQKLSRDNDVKNILGDIHALKYWTLSQGSLSGIHIFDDSYNITGVSGNVYYSGIPYYETVFIDSIVLKWKRKIKFHYKNFLFSYADDFRTSNSKNIFGLNFSSGYFNEILNLNDIPKIKIKIDSVGEKISKTTVAIQEWIRHCTAPDILEECGTNTENPDLVVFADDLTQLSGVTKIPVKRYTAFPNRPLQELEKFSYFPFPAVSKSDCFIFWGDARENLALQCAITQYNFQHPESNLIGFDENVFFKNSKKFLVKSEGVSNFNNSEIISKPSEHKIVFMPFPQNNSICIYIHSNDIYEIKRTVKIIEQAKRNNLLQAEEKIFNIADFEKEMNV